MGATTPSLDDRIAIVGAGPSGLFSAIELARLGYRDVTVFEETDDVAGTACTQTVGEHVFDLSTKFVPAVTLSGDRLYDPLERMMRDTGMTLLPSKDAMFFDPEEEERVQRPQPLTDINILKFLTDFVDAYHVLQRIDGCEGIQGLVQSGAMGPDETVAQWGVRHGAEAFSAFSAYLSDVFSGGPAALDHAGYVLKSRVHFVGGYLQSMFHQNCLLPLLVQAYDLAESVVEGEDPRVDLEEIRAFLSAPVSDTNNYVLKEGYKTFFRRLAAHEGLDVRTSMGVRAVTPQDGGGVELGFDTAPAEVFDRVLLTCPPNPIASMFPEGSEVRRLFSGHARDHRVHVWLFEATGWPTAALDGKSSGVLLDARNLQRLGTPEIAVDGTPYGVSREFADSDVLVAPVYLPEAMSLDVAELRLVRRMRDLGFTIHEILHGQTFRYPQTIDRERIAAGWFEEVEAMQGRGGVYYLGEAFAGQGVPTVLDFVRRFVPRMFAEHTQA